MATFRLLRRVFNHRLGSIFPARITDGGKVVYVESGLASLAGASAGRWAAISHKIVHIVHRDWARRYLFEEEIQERAGSVIVLGNPVGPSSSWSDTEKASSELALFCRQLELEADAKVSYRWLEPDITSIFFHGCTSSG